MRAKYAAQIRAGVTKAKFEVEFTIEMGRPPYASPGNLDTDLAITAYKRTIAKLVVKEFVRVGNSMVAKVHEAFPETREDGDRT